MSYIPDCREDEFYNYENLEKVDMIFIDGYDYLADDIISTAFDNLDMFNFKCDEGYTVSLGEYLNTKPQLKSAIIESLLEFVEMQRDETIVSIIDGYDGIIGNGGYDSEDYDDYGDEEDSVTEPTDTDTEQPEDITFDADSNLDDKTNSADSEEQ